MNSEHGNKFLYDFLEDRSEDELFELYNKMIDLDEYGFMGVSSEKLT